MICIIGSLNMDLVVTAKEIPKVGETLMGKVFNTVPGGKGANQAVAASRMGAEAWMVGKLGNDIFGNELRQSLIDSGVHCEHVYEKSDCRSGVALIEVDEKGGNSILVVPGANFEMTKSDIDSALSVIQKSKMVILQHELPLEVVKYAIKVSKREGRIVVLNPAPAYELEDEVLNGLDFIIPNEHELSKVSGMNTSTEEEQIAAAKSLIDRGVKHVIVTLGDKGCMLITPTEIKQFQAQNVEAVDTTAAGDSFIGGFCAVYEQSENMEYAIEMGQKAAALSVTRNGAQTSIPYLAEVMAKW